MLKRFIVFLGGAVLLLTQTTPSSADDKIQAFVSSKGKVVFTNLVDNPPAPVPQELTPRTEVETGGIPATLNSLVDVISRNHGVDPALVRAVMKTESGFNRYAVSSKGALGLMQLIPGTGKRFGVRDFFDPQQNIEGGVRYLKFLLQKFEGNLDLSLAAYNAGENMVQRFGRIPPIAETKDYVRKVRAIYKTKSAFAAQNTALMAKVATVPAEETQRIFRSVD